MGAGQQASTQELLDRTVAGERLSAAAAAALLADGEALLAVGRAAAAARRSRVPTQQVTFALGHTLAATAPGSEADLTAAIAAAVAAGCSEVTFRAAPVAALTRVVAAAKAHTPQLRYGLAVDDTEWAAGGISTEEALSALRDAGLSFLVRDSGSQPAVATQHPASKPAWLGVVAVAQHLGLDAAPTIVVGADETVAERMAQLVQVRDWLDRSPPQRDTDDARRASNEQPPCASGASTAPAQRSCVITAAPGAGGRAVSPFDYLQTLAVLRLFLDTTTHVSAAWGHVGAEVAQLSLSFGADDLGTVQPPALTAHMSGTGSTGAAGQWLPRLSRDELVRLIRAAGWTPAQRDTSYGLLETF